MGSPIPMNTMFLISKPVRPVHGSSTWKRAAWSCAAISAADRLRIRPICAVSQKRQPMAQPTWLETQSVRVVVPSRWRIGMTTLSVSRPSPRSMVNLSVSPSTCTAFTRPRPSATQSGSTAPAARPWRWKPR